MLTLENLRQGDSLTAQIDAKIGRFIIRKGQRFWLASSVTQRLDGLFYVAREGNPLGSGFCISKQDFELLFINNQ